MKNRRTWPVLITGYLVIALSFCSGGTATSIALKTIRADDMKSHLKFLGAPEFRGRNTPSAELDIASKYIALTAERIGLKPLMPGGSYYQEVPVEVTTVLPMTSQVRLITGAGERIFQFPKDVTVGRAFEAGKIIGETVFLGYGLSAPQLAWDDCGDIELKGKTRSLSTQCFPMIMF